MDFSMLVSSRRSIRGFLPQQVPDGLIQKLLEAARWAPSAGNGQPWHFFVVRSEEVRLELCERVYSAEWLRSAPVILVVCISGEQTIARYRERGRDLYCIQDTAAAIENILLAAKSEGLGTCWIGAFDEDACGDVLHLAEGVRPVALIPVGYAETQPEPRARRPIGEITTFL